MARVGQFSQPTSQYGKKLATIHPSDDRVTLTTAESNQADANAQANYLLSLINKLRGTPAPIGS
jgi:hypothetical protein